MMMEHVFHVEILPTGVFDYDDGFGFSLSLFQCLIDENRRADGDENSPRSQLLWTRLPSDIKLNVTLPLLYHHERIKDRESPFPFFSRTQFTFSIQRTNNTHFPSHTKYTHNNTERPDNSDIHSKFFKETKE